MTHEQLVQEAAEAVRPVFEPGKEARLKRRQELMAKHGWDELTLKRWASMVIDRSAADIADANRRNLPYCELLSWRQQDDDADNKYCTALYLIEIYRQAGVWAHFTRHVPGRAHFNMAYKLWITLPTDPTP